MRLTTARYYTPSGRSIQALVCVARHRGGAAAAGRITVPRRRERSWRARKRTCAGRLANDSLSEYDLLIRQIEADREKAEAAAELAR